MVLKLNKIAEMIHHCCPDQSLATEFCDEDRISFGETPCVTLRFKSEKC